MIKVILDLKDRVTMKKLKAELIMLSEKIDDISDKFCMDKSEEIIMHKDLEKLYTLYTANAFKYIKLNVKGMKDSTYTERYLSYLGWRCIIDNLNKKLKEGQDG